MTSQELIDYFKNKGIVAKSYSKRQNNLINIYPLDNDYYSLSKYKVSIYVLDNKLYFASALVYDKTNLDNTIWGNSVKFSKTGLNNILIDVKNFRDKTPNLVNLNQILLMVDALIQGNKAESKAQTEFYKNRKPD